MFRPDGGKRGLVVGDTYPPKCAFLAELRALSRELGLAEELKFLGHRGDLREIMAVSDVVLSLSQQPESFGRTLVEALALDRRFVGYDHGGVGEQLRVLFPQGLVPVGYAARLTDLCERLLLESGVPVEIARSRLRSRRWDAARWRFTARCWVSEA